VHCSKLTAVPLAPKFTTIYNPPNSLIHLIWNCVTNAFLYGSVAQPLYTRGTLNIVEELWRHTNSILHIVGGKMIYGIDWPQQLLINRLQPKNVPFDVHNYPSLLLCHLF
jgi:hypothetical protein